MPLLRRAVRAAIPGHQRRDRDGNCAGLDRRRGRRYRAARTRSTHRGAAAEAFFWTLIAVVFVSVAVVASRNLKRQHGHLQAANRVAGIVLVCSVAAGLLRAHYVPDVVEVTAFVLAMTGYSLIWAIFCRLAYLALEPFIRRRWPHTLVASTRLFAGRFLDPMVARDVLLGAVTGLVGVALVAIRFRISPAQHADMIVYSALESLRSWRRFGFVHLLGFMDAVQFALGGAFLIALSTAKVRRLVAIPVCAVVAIGIPLTIGGMPTSLADAAMAFVMSGLGALVFLKAGLLALATLYTVAGLLTPVPIALDPAVWNFPMSAVTLAMIAALISYAGFVAQSDQNARRTHVA
jgi:serine/threonine-protein kinase